MVKLAKAFRDLQPFKALVIGDFFLDTYTTGNVKRISPEAPVPIMEVKYQESRPGGAGNVVLNLLALGAQVFSVGRIGRDFAGEELKAHLEKSNTDTLLIEKHFQTPIKNRLIANSQQLLRIDFEKTPPIRPALEKEIIARIKPLIEQVNVVAVSDYGKGFLSVKIIQSVIEIAKETRVPVVVDPKGDDFSKYRGADVLKPNLSEAYAAAKRPLWVELDEVASQLLHFTNLLMITRSEEGIALFSKGGKRKDFPVRSKEVKDVTGAGDTVLAMTCLGLANRLEIGLVVELANIAAGLSIERVGCVQITLSEIAKRLLKIDAHTKIFDEHHTYALQKLLEGKKYSLLVLEKGQAVTPALFQTIRHFAKKKDEELIIYVRETHPDDALIHLLSSLNEVDYIILQTESLKHLCTAIHPYEIYFFKQDEALRQKPMKDLFDSLDRLKRKQAHVSQNI